MTRLIHYDPVYQFLIACGLSHCRLEMTDLVSANTPDEVKPNTNESQPQ